MKVWKFTHSGEGHGPDTIKLFHNRPTLEQIEASVKVYYDEEWVKDGSMTDRVNAIILSVHETGEWGCNSGYETAYIEEIEIE